MMWHIVRKRCFLGDFFMNRISIIAIAFAVSAGAAHGADLAARPYTKAPAAIVAPVYDWSGIYIGGHGGGVWGDRRFDVPNYNGVFGVVGPFGANADISGALAGGQIGLNIQSGPWVFGAQLDAAWTDARSDTGISPGGTGIASCNQRLPAPAIGAITRCTADQEWLVSATVRGGYAWDRLLAYVKGGGAWTRENYGFGRGESFAAFLFPNYVGSDTRAGWTVGVGLEYAFAQNWTVFGEYNYYDFGSYRERLNGVNIGLVGITEDLDIRTRFSTAKIGINYKFNWAQPVVAKY